jgi:hypothetical protein
MKIYKGRCHSIKLAEQIGWQSDGILFTSVHAVYHSNCLLLVQFCPPLKNLQSTRAIFFTSVSGIFKFVINFIAVGTRRDAGVSARKLFCGQYSHG